MNEAIDWGKYLTFAGIPTYLIPILKSISPGGLGFFSRNTPCYTYILEDGKDISTSKELGRSTWKVEAKMFGDFTIYQYR